jgi:hypothetical protein
MNSGFKFDTATQTYLPDISEVTLFCENKKVGTCIIDLAQYIDEPTKVEKAIMSGSEDPNSPVKHKVLNGDSSQYPGAFFTFKFKVSTAD